MPPPIALEWHEPLDYLPALETSGEDFALLYSGLSTPYSGRFSLLALHPQHCVEGADFTPLAQVLGTDASRFANFWLGYLGYGLKHATEHLPPDAPASIDLPALRMCRYGSILLFDHTQRRVTLHQQQPQALPVPSAPHMVAAPPIATLASDMSKETYLSHVQHIREAIVEGTLYQANLTRKFHGKFAADASPIGLFLRLSGASPAPYSALLKWGDTAIVSSSPERFLRLEADGSVEARPIKGSAARHIDPAEDAASRARLAASEKDRAENLMIVDLMRNDLSRSCAMGSVRTEALFEISSYATVHHMSSTITGQRRPDISPLQLVTGCFPPGSMTGAPKIRAMQLCSQLEPRARGIYSGAIGWFGGDGAADLSVVIRTLVMQGRNFEFQVGGAIVHDSTPQGEWEETLTKARGLAMALDIPLDRLRAL
jgi:aminodeoxychorismate synthase component I